MPWLDLEDGIAEIFDEWASGRAEMVDEELVRRALEARQRKADYDRERHVRHRLARGLPAVAPPRVRKPKPERAPRPPKPVKVKPLGPRAGDPCGTCKQCGAPLVRRSNRGHAPQFCPQPATCRDAWNRAEQRRAAEASVLRLIEWARRPGHYVVILLRPEGEGEPQVSEPIEWLRDAARIARGAAAYHGPGTIACVERHEGQAVDVVARFEEPPAGVRDVHPRSKRAAERAVIFRDAGIPRAQQQTRRTA